MTSEGTAADWPRVCRPPAPGLAKLWLPLPTWQLHMASSFLGCVPALLTGLPPALVLATPIHVLRLVCPVQRPDQPHCGTAHRLPGPPPTSILSTRSHLTFFLSRLSQQARLQLASQVSLSTACFSLLPWVSPSLVRVPAVLLCVCLPRGEADPVTITTRPRPRPGARHGKKESNKTHS